MGELDTYKSKRDFEHTPEPAGGDTAGSDERATFVIHKHAARQLHYDLRLEMEGVLASWAVPKGPSLDTKDKRLAVHVEDHPIEYGSFEGVIPQGEYGGGTVMVWDRGWWEPIGEMPVADQMAKGHLKFHLHGDKLEAGFALVRMKPREGEKRENWLLIKERDDAVRPHDEYDVLEARQDSAASGRTMEQIAAEEVAEPAISSDPDESSEGEVTPTDDDAPLAASGQATRGPIPTDAPMQLAKLVEQAPEDDGWIHEIKFDGYRLRAALEDGRAKLITRSGADWTDRFPEIADAVEALPVDSALLDGEVVVFGRHGVPDFSALQTALSQKRTGQIVYMSFDLLYMDGWDLREETLLRRKELLKALIERVMDTPIRYTDHVEGHGERFHHEACTLALEGSVSKRADRPWIGGRAADWQKVKCLQRQEFVVGGFTEGQGSRTGFGALLLGVHEGDALRYVGRVGTGFDTDDLESIRAQLDELKTESAPFSEPPTISSRTVHWVTPELIAEVSFQEWTREGVIRHPSFHGLRQDIVAGDVTREVAEAPPADGSAPEAAPDPEQSQDVGATAEKTIAGVRITNPDKVLYPASGSADLGVTKSALALYYEQVATEMLRFVAHRPLTLVRCPHGAGKNCFYQKHPDAKGFPTVLERVELQEKSGPQEYFFAVDAAGIVSLAQLGALEVHIWNSTAGEPERPDQLVFDLDPGPDVEWGQILDAAELVRDALSALGLRSFAKTTGGKGLHVVVPLVPGPRYKEARALARAFVDRIAAHDPSAFTAKMAKSARSGRVFIDYLRNAHGATAVAPYSTRARAGALISVPVSWDELRSDMRPDDFDVHSVPERLTDQALKAADPWAEFEASRHELTPALFAALGIPWQSEIEE